MDTNQIKTDYFGYGGLSKKSKCRVLTELMCGKGSCPFYKTWEQFDDGLRKYPHRDEEVNRSLLKNTNDRMINVKKIINFKLYDTGKSKMLAYVNGETILSGEWLYVTKNKNFFIATHPGGFFGVMEIKPISRVEAQDFWLKHGGIIEAYEDEFGPIEDA